MKKIDVDQDGKITYEELEPLLFNIVKSLVE
jgi:Ca2+-binding EF-hand superfamily protein